MKLKSVHVSHFEAVPPAAARPVPPVVPLETDALEAHRASVRATLAGQAGLQSAQNVIKSYHAIKRCGVCFFTVAPLEFASLAAAASTLAAFVDTSLLLLLLLSLLLYLLPPSESLESIFFCLFSCKSNSTE